MFGSTLSTTLVDANNVSVAITKEAPQNPKLDDGYLQPEGGPRMKKLTLLAILASLAVLAMVTSPPPPTVVSEEGNTKGMLEKNADVRSSVEALQKVIAQSGAPGAKSDSQATIVRPEVECSADETTATYLLNLEPAGISSPPATHQVALFMKPYSQPKAAVAFTPVHEQEGSRSPGLIGMFLGNEVVQSVDSVKFIHFQVLMVMSPANDNSAVAATCSSETARLLVSPALLGLNRVDYRLLVETFACLNSSSNSVTGSTA
ncbi:MAG: hypothetical protein US42_C0019G0006 [Candidatus Magasanikbacteria bacterium GW2011_GWC2_37_14]|uniref:Uncharacterized protein n=1 Tax=Candidatus Magasanikbacteria bacterium GW2011_GWC2_37_14 TaxID=1619046 RepID=A0A0G0JFG7_9BACT|nr:MAG: hypothetical protein US42_C0019G0006 [Candidatus Magasanikbacteria bacterium GW2011_GWC2_37_14]